MKRSLAFVALILLFVPLEETLSRLPGLHDLHPLLHIPLVLYFAMRLNTIEGAILAFLTGTLVDCMVPYPTGLAAFTDVGLFVAARMLLGGIRADGLVFEAVLAFVLAALFHLVTFGMRRVFGTPMNSLAGTGWKHVHLIACAATAATTPLIFRLCRRIERLELKAPGALQ